MADPDPGGHELRRRVSFGEATAFLDPLLPLYLFTDTATALWWRVGTLRFLLPRLFPNWQGSLHEHQIDDDFVHLLPLARVRSASWTDEDRAVLTVLERCSGG